MRLLGVGAMNSPRYRPAGLLVTWGRHRVVLDAAPEAGPRGLDAWLVCDERAELAPAIRRRAAQLGTPGGAVEWAVGEVRFQPLPVAHTSHRTCGFLIEHDDRRAVWAPEFWEWPRWADGADLVFADAAGWDRPIRFARGAGGHAAVLNTAARARDSGVGRLVFAHIGRPSIRAIDAGRQPPFGEWGREDATYRLG